MQFYRQRQDATTKAATLIQVNLPALRPGEAVELFACSVDNNSGETLTAQIGIAEGSDFFPLQAKHQAATGDTNTIVGQIFLFEGQNLAAQVTGTALNGPVTLYANGRVHDPDYGAETVVVDLKARGA